MTAPGRFLGITVMPEYIQSEGVDGVLDNLARAGATAVTTSPYVMAPADDGATGAREPPADAGAGGVRLLDRPLWGRRELFVRTAPSFAPDPSLYAGLRYQPAQPTDLTGRDGPVVAAFMQAARARGLRVYLQVQAVIPPGYRVQFGGPVDEDEPRLPDGRTVAARVDRNGSLASPHLRDYGCALIRDLGRAYPEIDGLRVDWPEYPPYTLDGLFTDFGPHAEAAAARLGFDFARMRADALALYRGLHGGLTDADLLPWLDEPDGGRYRLLRLLAAHPGVLDLLRLKAALVEELLAAYRAALTGALGPGAELLPQAFPPPWSLVSGFDYRRAAPHAAGILVKLYTMHWPMMLRFYGDALRAANPGLGERLLARWLVRLADISDADGPARLDLLRYPEPDEPHPVGAAAQVRKIRTAQAEAGGAVPVYAIAHGYGPLDDFRDRAEVAWRASGRRMWVNRYGYLGDAKLDALGALA
ncbi:MAG TPA: hypothetical protein VFG47_03630 [Geminicoccaceae bacterium]|nr:hypothetical protein [Geminicoccaceae bacterium]